MSVFNIFSKRQKQQRGEEPDIYTYDNVPEPLRVQIVHILRDSLGSETHFDAKNYNSYVWPKIRAVYKFIEHTLCREYGVFSLVKYPSANKAEEVFNFLLAEEVVDKVLDVVELAFMCVDGDSSEFSYRGLQNARQRADDAIQELNLRFREHGVGYEFRDGRIIRIDSDLIHSEAVRPALALLANKTYQVANDEFLKAHEHYRHTRYKDCLTWALKSLESTMKAICKKRKWKYDEGDTAKKLIEVCMANNLIPGFWQSHFAALRATLENGVPTVRNKLAGHGDGTEQVVVPQHLAAYVLHMTASTLLFLVEAEKDIS